MESNKACHYIDKISGIVAPFAFEGNQLEEFRTEIETKLRAISIPENLKKMVSNDIIMTEVDFDTGRIQRLSVFANTCLQYYMQRERAAISDLRTAIAIERFSSPRDAEAKREIVALKARAHKILLNLGHSLVDRKLMFQATSRIIGEVQYGLDHDEGGLYPNIAVRTNELRNIAIIYFPESLQSLLIDEVHRLSGIDTETLNQCIRPCEPSVIDYLDKSDYQFADPQNIIRERHLNDATFA